MKADMLLDPIVCVVRSVEVAKYLVIALKEKSKIFVTGNIFILLILEAFPH